MNSNSLSKDIILKHTNCNDIYTKFLGLNEFPKSNISSPFSDDKKPSFKVYSNGSFKCNSSTKQGDVWQFVAYLKNLDIKTQFKEVLKIIVTEMNIEYLINADVSSTVKKKTLQQNSNTIATNLINDYSITEVKPKVTVPDLNIETTTIAIPLQQNNDTIATNVATINETIAIEPGAKKLSIAIRDFTTLDLEYWNKLGVDKTILENYKVHSISNYCWTGKKPIYTKKESLAFAFELDKNYKLYIPNQLELGIKKNVLPPFPKNLIFGLEQLPEKIENLIICEGEKDTIVAHSRGFNTVTFGSGSTYSKKENIELLQLRCNNLFVCFDADETGITGINNLVKSHSTIIPILLPKNETIKGYDITDYFQEHSAQDFQKIIDLAVKNKNVVVPIKEKWTKFHEIEKYLSDNYDLRFNTIATDIEISKKNENEWKSCNEDSLWLELQKKSIAISKNNLISILKSDFVIEYNPIKYYFENLPKWDKQTDYITQYSKFIKLNVNEDQEQFEYHFKKWCVRAVKCVLIDGYYNKQAFVLSDNAVGQNIGKTYYLDYLTPKILEKYQQKDLPKDPKDTKIALAQNFIINLDELAYLQKSEVNSLKSLFSETNIKVRLPYASKPTNVQRIANFVGSTNNVTFLNDETGSVRWLCFIIDSIDKSYSKTFNIENLWVQAFALSLDRNFDENLTQEDIVKNEIRNEKFQTPSPEKELLNKYFGKPEKDNIEYYTSTDILNELSKWTSIRLTSVGVGRAMISLKFNRVKHNGIYCYEVFKRFFDTNFQ